MTQQPLDQVWARVAYGDSDAFSDLITQTHRALRVFIAARLPKPDLIEEVLQQTYVTAFEQRQADVEPGKVMAWLRGIARNMSARCWRELQRGERHFNSLERLLWADELNPVSQHEAEEETVELQQAVTSCLQRLPDRSRKVLLAAYEDDESQKRLAKRFSMRISAIKNLLFKTRGQLRECLRRRGVQVR